MYPVLKSRYSVMISMMSITLYYKIADVTAEYYNRIHA